MRSTDLAIHACDYHLTCKYSREMEEKIDAGRETIKYKFYIWRPHDLRGDGPQDQSFPSRDVACSSEAIDPLKTMVAAPEVP
jgi:hypothetical protein